MKNIAKLLNQSFRQSALVTGGTILNSALGLAFYILAARVMGPAVFGGFIYFVNLAILFSEIADWGMTSSLVKFSDGGQKLSLFFSAVLSLRVGILIIFALLGLFMGFVINRQYFQMWLAAASLLMVNLVYYSFLAKKQYLLYVFSNLSGNVLRLVVAYFFYLQGLGVTTSWLQLYAGVNFLVFMGGLVYLIQNNEGRLIHNKNIVSSIKQLFGFSKWLGGSFSLASLGAKIDIPIIYWLGGGTLTGIYASAQRLISIVPIVSSALDNVFAPKFSSRENYENNLREYFFMVLIIIVGIVIILPLSGSMITLFFGEQYLLAIDTFKGLAIGMGIFLLTTPFTSALVYYFGKPQKQFWISVLQLACTIGLYLILVPKFGLVGIVASFITIQVLSLLIYVITFMREGKLD